MVPATAQATSVSLVSGTARPSPYHHIDTRDLLGVELVYKHLRSCPLRRHPLCILCEASSQLRFPGDAFLACVDFQQHLLEHHWSYSH